MSKRVDILKTALTIFVVGVTIGALFYPLHADSSVTSIISVRTSIVVWIITAVATLVTVIVALAKKQ